MLSFSILSGHIPVRWQLQIMISRWEIWKAYLAIPRQVNVTGHRQRRTFVSMCFRICVVYTCHLEEPCPLQDKEDVVNIVWANLTRLHRGNGMMNYFHVSTKNTSEDSCTLSRLQWSVTSCFCLSRSWYLWSGSSRFRLVILWLVSPLHGSISESAELATEADRIFGKRTGRKTMILPSFAGRWKIQGEYSVVLHLARQLTFSGNYLSPTTFFAPFLEIFFLLCGIWEWGILLYWIFCWAVQICSFTTNL